MIPAEIIDWFRKIFESANRRLAEKMLNVPGIPEPHLDTTLIEHLMGFASPRRFKDDWAVRIDTYYRRACAATPVGDRRHRDFRLLPAQR